MIPYSPLAGGFLTGKYRKGQIPDSARAKGASRYFKQKYWDLIDLMEKIGKAKDASISQIALAWLLAKPVITSPIIGPRTLNQLNDNLGSINVHLTTEETHLLDEASDWK